MSIDLIREIIGYVGLVINLISMSCEHEKNLRKLSMVANSIYVCYGFMLEAIPIVLGGTVAVLLHSYRLYNIFNKQKVETRSVKR